MTVSDLDRLHSQLSKLEDLFPGYLTEIVEGSIVMNPVSRSTGRPFSGCGPSSRTSCRPVGLS